MEMTCPDCGMCKSHGTLSEIRKGQKDANGYTKCWPGKHAEGTKKSSVTGKQVRNCVPNESIAESFHDSVTFEIDSENAFNHVMGRFNSRIDWNGEYMVAPRRYWGAIQELAHEAGGAAIEIGDEHEMAEGEVTRTKTGLIHRATDKYGAGEESDHSPTRSMDVWNLDSVGKKLVKDLDASWGITWKNRGTKGIEIDDDEQDMKEATNDYFKRRKDEEDRIAGTKPPAKRTPQQTDYQKRRNKEQQVGEAKQKPSAQQRFNQRLKTKHGIDLDAMERKWREKTAEIDSQIAALKQQEKKVSEGYYQIDESWKSKLAGAALAGASAFGSGAAQAQTADFHTPLTQPTVQQTRADYIKKLPQVDSVDRTGGAQATVTFDGKQYQGTVLQPDDPRPRFGPGTVQAQVAAWQLGIRGLGSYVVYFVNDRAYIEMR
jgi:hypothetical protein